MDAVWNFLKQLFLGAETPKQVEAVFKTEWCDFLHENVPLYGCLPED